MNFGASPKCLNQQKGPTQKLYIHDIDQHFVFPPPASKKAVIRKCKSKKMHSKKLHPFAFVFFFDLIIINRSNNNGDVCIGFIKSLLKALIQ